MNEMDRLQRLILEKWEVVNKFGELHPLVLDLINNIYAERNIGGIIMKASKPDVNLWIDELFSEQKTVDTTRDRLRDEKVSIDKMYGSISVASRNYDRLIKNLEEKHREITRRILYLMNDSDYEGKEI